VEDVNGFVYSWKKHKDIVKKVIFDQFNKIDSENKKLRATIDLDDNFISFDIVKGISLEDLEKSLEESFGPNLQNKNEPLWESKKSIGILNRGKDSKFINNHFIGLDVGIQDEGEGTYASGNEFLNSLPRIEKLEIINGDKIEQHGDKNKAEINEKDKKEGWFSINKPFVYFIVLIVLYIVYASLKYFFPLFFK